MLDSGIDAPAQVFWAGVALSDRNRGEVNIGIDERTMHQGGVYPI